MAAISFTAANVAITSTSTYNVRQMGASTTQGQAAYLDATDNKWKLADSNVSAITAGSNGVGVFATPGASDGFGLLVTGGQLIFGGGLTKGTVYCVGATPGTIVPVSDLTTGDFVTILGVASSTSVLDVAPRATGIQI